MRMNQCQTRIFCIFGSEATWASVLRHAANSYLLSRSQALDKDLIAERPTLLRHAEVADLQAATSECIQREAAKQNERC